MRKELMIGKYERTLLSRRPPPEGCIGYDCEGKIIKEGDAVLVIEEDKYRAGNAKYKFCSKGQVGNATPHFSFLAGWFVTVKFDGGEPVGCVDYHLQLVNTT